MIWLLLATLLNLVKAIIALYTLLENCYRCSERGEAGEYVIIFWKGIQEANVFIVFCILIQCKINSLNIFM